MNQQSHSELVSIITPVLNAAETLEKTIDSVLNQTYQPIEYVVMDGGSTDGTVEIARRFEPRLTVISEPDRGLSDAINKAWRQARGDILAYLNADDQYFPDTVMQAVTFLNAHPDVGWLYGEPMPITSSGEPMPFQRPRGEFDYQKLLTLGVYISQPTTFIRRHVFEEFGPFDESLHYTMDYEYWLRIGRKYPGAYVPGVRAAVVRSRATRTQTGGTARSLEIERVVEKYGGHGVPLYARHLRASAYAHSSVQHLFRGELGEAAADQGALWRYPNAAVWGIAKLAARGLISERVEGRLRRLLLRRHTG